MAIETDLLDRKPGKYSGDYLLVQTRKRPNEADDVVLLIGLTGELLPDQDKCDLDQTYVLKLDDYAAMRDEVKSHFWAFNAWRTQCTRLWEMYVADGTAQTRPIMSFMANDDDGTPLARRMVEFISEQRGRLGDEGHWHGATYRDILLKRTGFSIAELPWRAQVPAAPALPVTPVPGDDYTDAVASFRFPSTTCMLGGAQRLSKLGGHTRFEKLFIRGGAGVYVVFDHDCSPLYVGMSLRFGQRLNSVGAHHKLKVVLKNHPLASVALIHYPVAKVTALTDAISEEEQQAARALVRELILGFEAACIRHYRPIYNTRLGSPGTSPAPVVARSDCPDN